MKGGEEKKAWYAVEFAEPPGDIHALGTYYLFNDKCNAVRNQLLLTGS